MEKNVIFISTIEPDSINFADLESIGIAIGDSKIIMLGEQDHGDAPTFFAKTRLIKYLHEKKGFNILVFESDFFGLNYYCENARKNKSSLDTFIKDNIYPLWTNCKTCSNLFNYYIPATLRTENPLIISGIDNQIYMKNIWPLLDSVLKKIEAPITKQSDYSVEIYPLLKSLNISNLSKDTILNSKATKYLSQIRNELLAKLSNTDFWVITTDNLISQNLEYKTLQKSYTEGSNIRDKQMALNLEWLDKVKFSKEKIIVWAHNYHISKFAGHYPEDFLNIANPMGSYFTKELLNNNKTYSIGFTSYQGKAGRLFQEKTYKVEKPETNSFENWIDKTYNFAFVDFKKFNSTSQKISENFYMSGATKGNRYHKSQKAQWNNIFDGVFYIKQMYSCLD